MKNLNRMKKISLIFLLAGVAFLAGACSLGIPQLGGGGGSQVLESKLPRAEAGTLSQSEINTLSEGNTAFAFTLYRELQSQPGNLFFSPYSISSALAMTYAGAAGDTAAEMKATLHFDLDDTTLHPAFNALDQYLASLADQDIPDDMGDPFQLEIANAIWGQKDFHFEEKFLDLLAENYGAGLRLLDYIQDPESSRQTINDWVSDQTRDKIQDLIPQGAIDSDTRLVLSNAIYFKATWMEAFEQSLTEEIDFHGLEGQTTRVQMMQGGSSVSYPYFRGEDFTAIELPYVGGQVSMLVLVPDQGGYQDFEGSLTAEQLDSILDNMSYTPVALHFPKFKFESEFSLAQTLAGMGMPSAFSAAADFSGMTGAKDLFISNVFHKAYIGVDEEGTEAAAATAVVMTLTAAPLEPIELTVDRPFIFLIRESQTGTVLFMGRVLNP
jgi:serpin B